MNRVLTSLRGCRSPRRENGAALVTVIFAVVALTAITATVALVATNDVISSGRDRQAAAALATADAGVSQALEYVRLNGVGSIECLESDYTAASGPTSTACTAAPADPSRRWVSPANPQQVRLDGTVGDCVAGQACYQVWISAVQPFNPPAVKTGTYRIRSTGYFGGGPGAKAVVVDFRASPVDFPVGVFGEQLDGNGGTRVYNESLFTRDCVSPRQTGSGNGTRFEGIDPYWDQPAAANTTSFVSSANNCGAKGYIHKDDVCVTGTDNALINDRDSQGGPVTSGPCYRTHQRADGSWYPDGDTTQFTVGDLEHYGYRPGGLSDKEYEALMVQAQGMGLHNPPAGTVNARLTAAVAAGVTHPVVYIDNVANVDLDRHDFPAVFNRAPEPVTSPPSDTTSTCTAPYSVVVVVRNGNLVYQGGNSEWRSLAVFVPEGDFRGNGGYNVVGTLFANNIELGGNEHWQLDDCWVDNMPGPLLRLEVTRFAEDDRSDAN